MAEISEKTILMVLGHFLAKLDKFTHAGCNDFPEFYQLVPEEEREAFIRRIAVIDCPFDAEFGEDFDRFVGQAVSDIRGEPMDWQALSVVRNWVDQKSISARLALDDVAIERARQDAKWGGAEHDDQHTVAEFVQWIEDYAGWARMMASMNSPEKARRRLIQVAALAVAAVEMIDRQGKEECPA